MPQPFFRELDDLYRRILVRPIDPSGYATYAALLASGEKSLEDVALILRDSEEFAARAGARERARRFLAAGGLDGAAAPEPVPGLAVRIVFLERDPARVAHLRGHLEPALARQAAGGAEVVAAIDAGSPEGRELIRARIGGRGGKAGEDALSPFMARKLACALSHALAWQSVRGGGPALVLEDDAVVAPDLVARAASMLAFAEERHPGWHLIHLYSPCLRPGPGGDPVAAWGDELERHHGNLGYLVSAAGRERLARLLARRIASLGADELARAQDEPHCALDHAIVGWARDGELRALRATEPLVETVGQIGPERGADDLRSNIFREPRPQ
jgi:hypothetical protein